MPMKKGHSPEVVHANIKEMMMSGSPAKQAIAASLASARKYKKMAMGGYADGGMMDDEEDGPENIEQQERSQGEIQAMGKSHPEDVENPEMQDDQRMLAKALMAKYDKDEMQNFAMGGLVEEDHTDGMDGNEPSEDMEDSTEEPMSDMPSKPASEEYNMAGLSEMAKKEIMERKMRRKFR